MKIVHPDDVPWHHDHPTGALAFKYLLRGDEASPENFKMLIARQDGDFYTRRHKHNFDQIRYAIRGSVNIGSGIVIEEGQAGYFPEGLPYGPQDDPLGDARPGERLSLALQFGGATGIGFMGPDRQRASRAELSKRGYFEDFYYYDEKGEKHDAIVAVWEHAMGRKFDFPHPRYTAPILMDPVGFGWKGIAEAPGASRKWLGAFSERAAWIELVKLEPGAAWRSTSPDALRLMLVLEGDGACCGRPVAPLCAIQADPGEELVLEGGGAALQLILVGLPRLDAAIAPAAGDRKEAALTA